MWLVYWGIYNDETGKTERSWIECTKEETADELLHKLFEENKGNPCCIWDKIDLDNKRLWGIITEQRKKLEAIESIMKR